MSIEKMYERKYSELLTVVNPETWGDITVLLKYFKVCTKITSSLKKRGLT